MFFGTLGAILLESSLSEKDIARAIYGKERDF